MRVLRQFIREYAQGGQSQRVWNYWLRRPHNGLMPDIGGDIKQKRQDDFEGVAADFQQAIKDLEHSVQSAASISQLEDMLLQWGLDAYDVAPDATAFDDAAKENDVAELRRQLVNGLKTWSRKTLQNTMRDDFNSASLLTFLDNVKGLRQGI